MGKLHTLRRAIERDPNEWSDRWGYPKPAKWTKDGWVPGYDWWGGPKPYRSFVKYVLSQIASKSGALGNADGNGPGDRTE
jgi:hypothetical protein